MGGMTWMRWTMGSSIGLVVIGLALALALPSTAAAGSPFADDDYRPARGGGTGTGTGTGSSGVGGTGGWEDGTGGEAGYQPLASPGAAPLAADPINPNNALAWLPLELNPGKWLVDSVLGSMSGVLFSSASVFETLGRFGGGEVVNMDGSVDSSGTAVFGFLFQTPEQVTVDWDGATGIGSPKALHAIVRDLAMTLLILLMLYRGLLLLAGSDLGEVVDLVVAMMKGAAAIQLAWVIGGLCIKIANIVAERMAVIAFGTGLDAILPLDPVTMFWGSLTQGSSIAIALLCLVYWGTLGIMALHALARIVLVNIMLIVSPLIGLSLASGNGGWNYSRVWFFRFVEMLSTPIIWAMTLGFAHGLMSGFGVATHPILGPVLGIFAMFMALKAPKLVGLAAQETITGGRTILNIVKSSATTAMKSSGGGGGSTPGGGGGGGGGGSRAITRI